MLEETNKFRDSLALRHTKKLDRVRSNKSAFAAKLQMHLMQLLCCFQLLKHSLFVLLFQKLLLHLLLLQLHQFALQLLLILLLLLFLPYH